MSAGVQLVQKLFFVLLLAAIACIFALYRLNITAGEYEFGRSFRWLDALSSSLYASGDDGTTKRPQTTRARRPGCVDRQNYTASCLRLFKELRYPDPKTIHRPPLLQIPKELVDEFTMHGEMPQLQYRYIDEAYGDSMSSNKSHITGNIADYTIEGFLRDLDNATLMQYYGGYGDVFLYRMMNKNKAELKGKSFAVLGTIVPWVEAIALKLGLGKITTLDYTRMKYQNDRGGQLEWRHVFDFFDDALASKQIEQFESAASFSSIEHSGLGRYGDPLDPNGDVKAVRQMHCMLKPGGLFFLGLEMTGDNTSVLCYNAHRLYGPKRVAKILANDWDILEVGEWYVYHQVHVLRKRDNFC